MDISAIDAEWSTDQIIVRDPIYCEISGSQTSHLFHQAGIIGKFVREHMIFPLASIRDSFQKAILRREDWISTDLFWRAPFKDLRYPRQSEIRDYFVRYDQFILIEAEGKQIKLKCRIIEPKGCPKEGCLNHLLVQGNISTLDNNMPGIYPFLDSYLKEKEGNPNLPPGRFILLNHYDNKISDIEGSKEEDYYPGDLDEWGFVFKKTLESLVDQYGKLQLLAAHSLGNIPIIEHLKHVKDEEFSKLFPRTLFLAQGPSSLFEVANNVPFSFEWYPWGRSFLVGWVAYFLFKWTGWDINLDQTLVERLNDVSKNKEAVEKLKETNVIITEVVHDYYFPGKASLCASDKLDDMSEEVNLYRLTFNPPLSWGIPRAQHNYNIGLLQRQDLVRERLHWAGHRAIHSNDPKEIIKREGDCHFTLRHEEGLVHAILRSAWAESLRKPKVDLMGRVMSIASAA